MKISIYLYQVSAERRHTRTRIIFPKLRVSTLSAPPNLPRDKNRPIICILRRLDQRLLLEFGNPEVKSDKKYKRHGHVSDMQSVGSGEAQESLHVPEEGVQT